MKDLILPAIILAACSCPFEARGQLSFTLTKRDQFANAGGIVSFEATLQNTGLDALFLNGDSFDLPASFLSLDDGPFLANFPAVLNSGEAITANLFDVAVASTVIPAKYLGSFSILGGVSDSGQDLLGTQDFSITVPQSSTPEPLTLLTLGFALVALCLRRSAGHNHST